MDEKLNTNIETGQPNDAQSATPAEAQNTESTSATSEPGPVPYSRFKQLNDEAKNLKAQLDKLTKTQAEAAKAGMTEVERLKAEKAELEEQAKTATAAITEMRMKDAFRREAAAQKVRFIDGALDDAYALADLTGVQIDESGAVRGMDNVVKKLAKTKPYLLERPEPANIDASAGTGSGKPIPENKEKKEAELRQRFNIR